MEKLRENNIKKKMILKYIKKQMLSRRSIFTICTMYYIIGNNFAFMYAYQLFSVNNLLQSILKENAFYHYNSVCVY